jgi:hypothetical protein
MSISAIAKKRLAFHKDDGGFITVKPNEFVTLPDYVRKDPMFHWAVKDGVLVVSEQVIVPVEAPAKAPEKVEEAPVEEEAPAPKKRTTKKKAADK